MAQIKSNTIQELQEKDNLTLFQMYRGDDTPTEKESEAVQARVTIMDTGFLKEYRITLPQLEVVGYKFFRRSMNRQTPRLYAIR